MNKWNKLIIVTFIITIFLFCSINVQQITVHAASGTKVEVVYSSYNDTDTNNQLTHQTDLTMADMDNTSTAATIVVDPSITYQQWDGFGGSLEDDTIWELGRLSSSDKEDVLNDLFNPATGNNYTLMRLSIGACDFSPDYDSSISPDKGYWTYDDNDGNADSNLTNFSIQRDIDDGVIETLLEVLEINPDVRFFASMWSPPAWMKTNGTLVNGGHVQSQYYSALANYYVKYIQAYEDEGIPIYAVTLQNEPAISVGYPSTIWSVDEYVSFAQVLGAAFESNNIKTKNMGSV